MKKRIFCLFMAIACTICDFSVQVMAEDNKKTKSAEENVIEMIESMAESSNMSDMTIEELNKFIHEMVCLTGTEGGTGLVRLPHQGVEPLSANDSIIGNVALSIAATKAAWLAAAEIAKKAGYECSGTLVEYSVGAQNYRETNGMFAQKIKKTNTFTSWKKKPKKDSLVFTKSEDPDLYYSIHEFNISFVGGSRGGYAVISDTYDFDIKFMDGLFSTIVNDWAWLCSHTFVLHKIGVEVKIGL